MLSVVPVHLGRHGLERENPPTKFLILTPIILSTTYRSKTSLFCSDRIERLNVLGELSRSWEA